MPIPRWLLEQPIERLPCQMERRPNRRRRRYGALVRREQRLGFGWQVGIQVGIEPMLVDRDPHLGGLPYEVVGRLGDPIEQWQQFEWWALRLSLQGVRLQEGKMVKTKEEIQAARRKADASHGRALESFRRLIADVLASDEPARFAEAARICAAAHGLVAARATRVGEMGEAGALGNADMVMNALNNVGQYPVQNPMRMGNVNIGAGYDLQAHHDTVAAAAMMQDAEARKRDAEASCAETLELARLSEMAESLTAAITKAGIDDRAVVLRRRRGAVEARIDQLTTRMEGRASAASGDQQPGKGQGDADVVPADDPGRHQPQGRGAAGRAAHRADGQGAVAD
jgi:hypothetical protein